MATIITKNSGTASSVPTGAQLTAGELAVNTADKRLFTKNGGGTVVELGTNPSSLTLPNGTANGVPYLNASKVLTSGSALTFDGTNLGIGTSSPDRKLSIYTTDAAGKMALFSNGNTNTNLYLSSDPSSGGAVINVSNNAGSAALPLLFQMNGSEKMRLDASGNLGLGVTPSAWSGSYKAFEMGTGTALMSYTGTTPGFELGSNSYFNGTNYIYKINGRAGQYVINNGVHSWGVSASGTAGNAISFTQAMTLDASGNLGVGTTSPEANGRLTLDRSGSNYLMLRSGGVNRMSLYVDSGVSVVDAQANPLVFNAGSAERARIDSSGNLLVGTTSMTARVTIQNATSADGLRLNQTGGTSLYINNTNASYYAYFVYNGTNTGRIETSGTTTSYVTSSDYRLKENVQPMTGALAKVAALKPVTYTWKADGSAGEGFIAHELAEVVPQCVTGEKDAVDEKGNPKYQGIDTSFLVGTLTAAIQELKASLDEVKLEFDAYKAAHP